MGFRAAPIRGNAVQQLLGQIVRETRKAGKKTIAGLGVNVREELLGGDFFAGSFKESQILTSAQKHASKNPMNLFTAATQGLVNKDFQNLIKRRAASIEKVNVRQKERARLLADRPGQRQTLLTG